MYKGCPMICMHDFYALYGPIYAYESVKLLHLVSFLSSLHVQISPPVAS